MAETYWLDSPASISTRPAAEMTFPAEDDRRIAVLVRAVEPESLQGANERTDRPFAHMRVAVDHHFAFDEGRSGGQKAHRGAGIAQKQRARGRIEPPLA